MHSLKIRDALLGGRFTASHAAITRMGLKQHHSQHAEVPTCWRATWLADAVVRVRQRVQPGEGAPHVEAPQEQEAEQHPNHHRRERRLLTIQLALRDAWLQHSIGTSTQALGRSHARCIRRGASHEAGPSRHGGDAAGRGSQGYERQSKTAQAPGRGAHLVARVLAVWVRGVHGGPDRLRRQVVPHDVHEQVRLDGHIH